MFHTWFAWHQFYEPDLTWSLYDYFCWLIQAQHVRTCGISSLSHYPFLQTNCSKLSQGRVEQRQNGQRVTNTFLFITILLHIALECSQSPSERTYHIWKVIFDSDVETKSLELLVLAECIGKYALKNLQHILQYGMQLSSCTSSFVHQYILLSSKLSYCIWTQYVTDCFIAFSDGFKIPFPFFKSS